VPGEVLHILEGHVLIEKIGHDRDPEAVRGEAKRDESDYSGENATQKCCPKPCPKRCRLRPNDAVLPYGCRRKSLKTHEPKP
jgi:hypothetical protein